VKISRLSWRTFRIPLRRTYTTSQEASAWREAIILRLQTANHWGLGEIAPLPAAGSIGMALSLLAPLAHRLPLDVSELPAAVTGDTPLARAVRCGLDTAACDLMARRAGLSLAAWMGGQPRTLAVNATIAEAVPAAAARAAADAVAQGFGTVKVKVGVMPDVEAECARIALIRQAIGADTQLRLDANQAWSVPQAIAILRALEPLAIEYVEQPVAAQPLAALAHVRRHTRIPIAADESVTDSASVRELIELAACDLIVIKPMVLGGLRVSQAIARQAAQGGLDSVVTTTIDSGVGVAAALHLAAALDLHRACGLATAALLESDLVTGAVYPRNGTMTCPCTPGLGVTIDEAAAAAYRVET